MRRIPCALLLCAGISSALAAPHPVHDDGGNINWRLTYAGAFQQAQAAGKPIIVLGFFENDDPSKNVAKALQDPELYKLVNRYFIPFVIDVEKAAPNDNLKLFPRDKIGGNKLPYVTFFTDRGMFIQGTSGDRPKDMLLADIKKVLAEKGNTVPAATEATLKKQVETLEKALEAKNFKQAGTTFAAIAKVRGYSPSKDKAYDLMDDAQFEAVRLLKEAVNLAGMDQYNDARKLIAGIPKEFAGLPVTAEVKDHQEALTLLEAASQATKDKKGAWQATATTKLGAVLTKYPDGPYAGLATKRKLELSPKK